MNRRDFLKRLGGAAAAVALSPLLDLSEIISAPAVLHTGISLNEINRITLAYIMPAINDMMFRTSPLLEYMQRHGK